MELLLASVMAGESCGRSCTRAAAAGKVDVTNSAGPRGLEGSQPPTLIAGGPCQSVTEAVGG